MGANILANLLGYEGDDCFFEAACVFQAPINMPETGENLKTAFFGFYNKVLGKAVVSIAKEHE